MVGQDLPGWSCSSSFQIQYIPDIRGCGCLRDERGAMFTCPKSLLTVQLHLHYFAVYQNDHRSAFSLSFFLSLTPTLFLQPSGDSSLFLRLLPVPEEYVFWMVESPKEDWLFFSNECVDFVVLHFRSDIVAVKIFL